MPQVFNSTWNAAINTIYNPINGPNGRHMVGGGTLTYIGTSISSTTSTFTWPAGTQAGDTAVIMATRNSGSNPTLSATGGTTTLLFGNVSWSGTTFRTAVWSVTGLTAGDVSTPPTVTQGTGRILVMVYRNTTSILLKNSGTASGPGAAAPFSVTGYTASAGARTIAWVAWPDGSSPTSPTGFTTRGPVDTFFGVAEHASYVSGNIVWPNADGDQGGTGQGLGYGVIEVK